MRGADLEAAARRAAAGDKQAFEAVCQALQDDIWRYCYTLTGDRELAFEAAQETFVRSVTAIRRFRGDSPVRLWLLVLARRATWQVLSAHRRRMDLPGYQPLPEAAGGDGFGHVEVEQLIAALPIEQRQAFVLTQLLGLSYEQAARVVGCPTGTIRSRVHRSRERLAATLSEHDERESDAAT